MTRRTLRDACPPDGFLDGALQHGLVQVMTAPLARHPVDVEAGGRKHPLPRPLATGVRVLPGERPGQLHPAGSPLQIGSVLTLDQFRCRTSSVFTAAGRFIAQWRDIHKPTDIYFDAQEIVYVSEQRPSISVMEKSGKVLARFETAASGHGLWVDSAGDIYLASVGAKQLIKYARKR
jgi:hypothetical protein